MWNEALMRIHLRVKFSKCKVVDISRAPSCSLRPKKGRIAICAVINPFRTVHDIMDITVIVNLS